MAQEIQFEKALNRLEKIVSDLEAGDVSLEDALKTYEEGVKLSRACQDKLIQAEKKIEVLTRILNGAAKKEPFQMEEDGGAERPGAKRKKKAAKPDLDGEDAEPAEDEDMLF